jgi:hypothetical protein
VPVPAAPPQPRREGQPVNVKVDLTIVDQRGTTTAAKKTVTMVVADAMMGIIRSDSNYRMSDGRVISVPLNVDAEPQVLADGKVRLRVNLQYDLPNSLASGVEPDRAGASLFTSQLRENLAVVVENGKSIVVAQSADPVNDRQVTVELKATILR